MEPKTRKQLLTRLSRAEGQVAALRRMVESDVHCKDVLLQIAAARGALAKAGQVLLSSHVATCVHDAMSTGNALERQQQVDDLLEVFERFGGISPA